MNVQEVLNIAKERKTRNKDAVKKIIENIHKKIRYYAGLKKETCSYMIPPLVNDTPLYNLADIINDVFKFLDSEGYIVTAYANGQVDISWNEVLVEQKVNTDAFLLNQEEKKLRNLTRKSKKIDERFSFLANPKKIIKEKSLDEKLDQQVEKILYEKNKLQNKYKSLI